MAKAVTKYNVKRVFQKQSTLRKIYESSIKILNMCFIMSKILKDLKNNLDK